MNWSPQVRFCQLPLGKVCTISNQFRQCSSQKEHDPQQGMVFLMRVVYEFILSRCRPQTVFFRGLPRCFASLVSRGFLCLRWAEKLNLFLSSSVFMGSFNSYELFIIPRRDSVIHNSGFSNYKYSLFIFV